MPRTALYSDEDIYVTWVASGRNASAAARQLDINPSTVLYHVKNKNFHQRYLAEYGSTSNAIHKVAVIEAIMELPRMLDQLREIAYDQDQKATDRINAIKTYLSILPKTEPDTGESNITFIEAKASVSGTQASPQQDQPVDDLPMLEAQVREALEENIIRVAEQKSR